ncbi:MAG: hypothetical protein PUC37_11345 [Spirochaetales bacterium]|nr:hypothetical protein [Spirochaetales bacterium]
MKKLVVILFLFIFYSFAFADANFILQNNQVVNIKFDDVTPDIWITATSGEKTDSYKIEAIGPASNIVSLSNL